MTSDAGLEPFARRLARAIAEEDHQLVLELRSTIPTMRRLLSEDQAAFAPAGTYTEPPAAAPTQDVGGQRRREILHEVADLMAELIG